MPLNILVCVKRVPLTGARIRLTEDQQAIDTSHLGFAVSPHEECAVEEAVQLIEKHGGQSRVITLGPVEATEQLREALAMGIDQATLMETNGSDWGPEATARVLIDAVQAAEEPYDLLLFGNESADNANFQVGIRVAQALDLPCLTGVKGLEIEDRMVTARREVTSGWEIYEIPLPAVITIKEGINLPRYPPLRAKLQAKKKEIQHEQLEQTEERLNMVRLKSPPETGVSVEVLGEGPEAAERDVEVLKEMGVV